jgi:hypothetical protein
VLEAAGERRFAEGSYLGLELVMESAGSLRLFSPAPTLGRKFVAKGLPPEPCRNQDYLAAKPKKDRVMRILLVWLLGIPIPLTILLYVFHVI